MIEEELEELEIGVEKFRMGLEKKESLLHFENAFFIPLFAVLILLSIIKTPTDVTLYLFILAIILVMIDLVYSLFIYKQLEKKSQRLDVMIEAKLKKLHS